MSRRPPKHRALPVAAVTLFVGAGMGLPGPAGAAPEMATPSPGGPAGTEYGLPFQQGRDAGGGGGSFSSGGGNGSGIGGVGPGGGGSGGGGNSGSGGVGATAASAAQLFGAGIVPTGHSGGSSSSSSSNGASGKPGAGPAVQDAGTAARAVSDRLAAQSSNADGQVALIVVLLLGTAVGLAIAIRFIARRSPPAGAA